MTASPRVFSIPTGVSFVDALARGLLERHGADPLALADVIVLLPNRRAARALREAFLRVGEGRALLLPGLRAIGDVDEDELALAGEDLLAVPPALADLRRRSLLASCLQDRPEIGSFAQALALAAELGRLLDEVLIEGSDLARLKDLAPQDFAAHWQATLDFLRVLTGQWPAILAAEQAIEAAARRNHLLELQTARWLRDPPRGPVYVAGSTGSIPASARLIAAVARFDAGAVILPGLDHAMDAADRTAILQAPTHPQHGMLRLLDAIGVAPAEVAPWPAAAVPEARQARLHLVREAFRPGDTAHAWAEAEPFGAEAATGLRFVEAQSAREEAAVIALLLREVLEVPARRAALVTPDRDLARRVAAMLQRWGIEIDDSAGTPLARTPQGGFLRLLAAAAAAEFAPVELLAVLKHPLAIATALAPGGFRRTVRRLERRVLRGTRPPPGLAGLRRSAVEAAAPDDVRAFVDALASVLEPLAADAGEPLRLPGEHLRRLIEAAAALATEGAECRLWAGEAGELLAGFVQEAASALEGAHPISLREWQAVLDELMQGIVVRPAFGRHPRLAVWGPIEARLQQADRLILGGLNEGTWPSDIAADPWLSRPMREALGLPPLERRIGLAAHDVQQALGAPDVVLTRALRVEGAKTVPSRWWLRLATLLGDRLPLDHGIRHWAQLLDQPAAVRPESAPAPRPPVAARPKRLSVTQVETLIRDPYAVYARHVLRLRRLDPLAPESDALERGNFVHLALERWIAAHRDDLPPDALDSLVRIGSAVASELAIHPATLAFWWPRFLRAARWLVDWERARREAGIRPLATEISGELRLGDFTLVGKADRIDRLPGGAIAIIDYKTGQPRSEKQVAAGLAPQLPLEAAIAAAGGFAAIGARQTGELLYLRVSGGREPGKERRLDLDPAAAAAEARAGLEALIGEFGRPATPYLSRPHPQFLDDPGDYDHLARLGEWSPYGDGP